MKALRFETKKKEQEKREREIPSQVENLRRMRFVDHCMWKYYTNTAHKTIDSYECLSEFRVAALPISSYASIRVHAQFETFRHKCARGKEKEYIANILHAII